MSKQPSDSAVRAAAIDPAHSFLIQAPAGSGKTELLTDRILALLATVNRPEEIAAITFTRKAASEMHARVLSKLQAGLGPQPAEPYKLRSWQLAQAAMRRDQELGWNLLQYPARLSIRTIDSFCAWLVRAMPWLSSLGGVPSITDNAREHYEAAAQATLAMADDNASVAGLIAHLDVDMRAARGLLADMLANRDQWLPLLGQGGDVDALLHNLYGAIETDLAGLARAMPMGWAPALAPSVSRAANVLAGKGSLDFDVLCEWDGTPFDADVDCLPQWQALANMLLTGKGTLRRRVTIKEGFEAKADYKDDFVRWLDAVPESEAWIPMLAGIRLAPVNGYTADQIDVLRLLTEVLWLAAAQLNVRFTEAAEVDFAEISQRALQALGHADDPTDLLLALDTTIRHVLVDEFQDTSQSQIDLLERLTSGWQPEDGRTLFLVGDPMQSIYRFRKADVGGFLRVKAQGLGAMALTALELTDNFRSQANLVEWVNTTCGPIFPRKNHSGLGAITYTPSVPFNDGVDGVSAQFHPVWVRKDTAADTNDDVSASAESVAVQLAKDALRQYPDSDHPVAILVRARTHLDGIVHRLAQDNIPCRAVELVSLQSRQVVIDLAQLARALSHAGDRLAWLSVLRSPLCGLTLDSLHAVFGADLNETIPALLSAWLLRDAQGGPGIDNVEARRLRQAATVLLDSGNAAGTIPFAAWLEACWQRLGGPDIYPSASDRTDAERLLRLIEELAPYGGLNPVDLEERLARLYAAPSATGRAVEVMTIHKSKGLEFETVILAGLHKRPRGDTPPLMRFEYSDGQLLLGPIKHKASDDHDPVSLYLAERDKKRAAYETDRLLYVALTRARQQLHLIGEVGVGEDGAVKPPTGASLLGRLWDHMQTPQAPREGGPEGAAGKIGADPAGRLLVRRTFATLPDQLAAPRVSDGWDTPWQWRPESGDESVIGTVAHAWLERLGKDGVDAWPALRLEQSLPVFRKQLARAGLAESALDGAARVLRDTLIATVQSERGAWLLRVARAYREWALLDISGRVSVIDLAISQEHDWLVVDYKTGVARDGETREDFAARMRERHRDQIERYCAHVSALDGRPARGALYFPRADVWVDYADAGGAKSC